MYKLSLFKGTFSAIFGISLVTISFATSATEKTILKPCTACTKGPPIEILKRVEPLYPESPYWDGNLEGTITLELKVNSNGEAQVIKVLDSSPIGKFDRIARKALKQWSFTKSKDEQLRCGMITLEFQLANSK